MLIQQAVRDHVENENDYLLRKSQICQIRLLLDKLDNEAERIRLVELPLWYVEKSMNYYGIHRYSGIETGSWLLIREDVDPAVLQWASECCSNCYWYGEGYDPSARSKSHPIYRGFSNMIEIGNKVTPGKKYYQGRLNYTADSVRDGMKRRLGSHTWSETPLDINGKPIYG